MAEGARLRLDGRSLTVAQRPRGCFIGPTGFDDVTPEMSVGRAEDFGPVVRLMRARTWTRRSHWQTAADTATPPPFSRNPRQQPAPSASASRPGCSASMSACRRRWGSFHLAAGRTRFLLISMRGRRHRRFLHARESDHRTLVRCRGAEGWMGLIEPASRDNRAPAGALPASAGQRTSSRSKSCK